MIRVELFNRQRRRSPWSKALFSALVICGGLYGIHQFFPALVGSLFSTDSAFIPTTQQEAAPSPVVQRETAPKSTAQQETTSSPIVQQEITPDPVTQQETAASMGQEAASSPVAVQQEITPEPTAQRETAPSSVVQQEEAAPSPVVQQETTASPVVQQEITPEPVTQRETASSTEQEEASNLVVQQEITSEPAAQQETAASTEQEAVSSPVAVQQETTPNPVVQQETTPRLTPTPSQTFSSQRSTACHQAMRIDEQVPTGVRLASLNCNSTGEYRLEGISPSHKVLRTFRLGLQALPLRVSFSTWREERALHFAFQGRFAERDASPLAALSSDQAEEFFGKVAHWADTSGLDSLSIHEPIHGPLSSAGTHQRQKLWGLGSPQQIDAFLQQLQQAEEVAALGEVLLVPVKSDEHGWVQARLYAAVDIIVDEP
jgi:hypothetical protein